MLDLFCRPEVSTTSKNRRIPRVWALLFFQTLEAASNQSQFIVKKCLGSLALLRGGNINSGLLIANIIKYMANVAQKPLL